MALSGRNREFTLEVFMQSKRSQRTQFRRNGAQPGAISIFNFMPAIRFAATPDKKPGMTTTSPQCPTSVTRQNKASFQADRLVSGRLRMQCDSVAFSIANYCPKPVRSDGLFVFENLAAAFLDGPDRIVQPALDAQVNQRAMLRGLVVLRFDQAPGDIFIGVRQQAKFHPWHCLLGNGCSKNSGIELDGSIEVIDGNVGPTDGVAFAHIDIDAFFRLFR